MLEITNLHAHYSGVRALDSVSLAIQEREIISLVGANGAGKTTTLRSISGFIPITQGTIRYLGTEIETLPSNLRVNLRTAKATQRWPLFPYPALLRS